MTSDKKQICGERKKMQLIKNSYLKLRHKLRDESFFGNLNFLRQRREDGKK